MCNRKELRLTKLCSHQTASGLLELEDILLVLSNNTCKSNNSAYKSSYKYLKLTFYPPTNQKCFEYHREVICALREGVGEAFVDRLAGEKRVRLHVVVEARTSGDK